MAKRSGEPVEDDLTTPDHVHFYESGKLVLTLDDDLDDREMWKAIHRYMEKSRWFPNVWWISDHGNAHLMKSAGKWSRGKSRR